ncbi:MAG TPA: hypothetical protein VMV86_04675 [Methanosarcinales archaeon]|nr:hypothetical protein [Methanosarcinales archaeon]
MQPWEIELLSSRLFFSMPWYVYAISYFLIMGLLIGAHEAISFSSGDEDKKKEKGGEKRYNRWGDERWGDEEKSKEKETPSGPPNSLVWVIWPISLPFLLAFAIAYYPVIYGKKAFEKAFTKIKDMKNDVAW